MRTRQRVGKNGGLGKREKNIQYIKNCMKQANMREVSLKWRFAVLWQRMKRQGWHEDKVRRAKWKKDWIGSTRRARPRNRRKTIYAGAQNKRRKRQEVSWPLTYKRVDGRRTTEETQRRMSVTKKRTTGSSVTFLKTGARGRGRTSEQRRVSSRIKKDVKDIEWPSEEQTAVPNGY